MNSTKNNPMNSPEPALSCTCEMMEHPVGIDCPLPRFSYACSAQVLYHRITVWEDSTPQRYVWDSGITVVDSSTLIPYAGEALRSGTAYEYRIQVWDPDNRMREGGDSFVTGILEEQDGRSSESSGAAPGENNICCAKTGQTQSAAPDWDSERVAGRPDPEKQGWEKQDWEKQGWEKQGRKGQSREEQSWEEHWIGGAGLANHSYYIRWPFSIEKEVRNAAFFAASPNYFVPTLDGRRLGDTRLDNAFTDYTRTLLYSTFPAELTVGGHVLGLELGNGWYAMEKAERIRAKGEHIIAVLLRLEYMDGEVEWRGTNPEECYVTSRVPCLYNSVYRGERYDARREKEGWDTAGYIMRKEDGWNRAFQQDSPGGVIRARNMEPIRMCELLSPAAVYRLENGDYTVDFGQNYAGWIRLHLHEAEGTCVRMTYAEIEYEDHRVNTSSLNGNEEVDEYIAAGRESEVYEPRFTYHGFRYVQISGLSGALQPEEVEGCVVHSDVRAICYFDSNSDLLNRLYRAMLWTEKSNLYGIPTDCPQRAERMGWLNDMTVRNECALYNYRLPNLYRKWLGDIRDTQGRSGAIADTAPFYRMGQKPADPVSSSFLLTAWNTYLFYGDIRILEENYEACRRWVYYLDRHSEDGIVRYSPMGDWASPKQWCDPESIGAGAVSRITPTQFMATGFQYYNWRILGKMARVLGRDRDMAAFRRKSHEVKEAFQMRYYSEERKEYCSGGQAVDAFPLYLNLVPAQDRAAVLSNLVTRIRGNGTALTTGNLCSRYVPEVLFLNGEADLAYELLTRTEYPSWGYMLEEGATTLWERWEKVDTWHGRTNMASFNHPMSGAVTICFQKYLAGIRPCEEGPGFRKIVIRPVIPTQMRRVSCRLETLRGEICSEWLKAERPEVSAGGTAEVSERKMPEVSETEMSKVSAGEGPNVPEGGMPAESSGKGPKGTEGNAGCGRSACLRLRVRIPAGAEGEIYVPILPAPSGSCSGSERPPLLVNGEPAEAKRVTLPEGEYYFLRASTGEGIYEVGMSG